MLFQSEIDTARPVRRVLLGNAGMGVLRVSLLFGSIAVALALIIAPIAADKTRTIVARANAPFGIDQTVTGSVGTWGKRYTVHRSVLQSSRNAICIIQSNGARHGDC